MVFDAKNKKDKPAMRALTEEDIKNRLYGSGVGISVSHQQEEPAPSKKHRGNESKTAFQGRKLEDERVKIQKELHLLRKDLEQTKRKLERMRGLKAKKIRLLVISLLSFFVILCIGIVSLRFVSRSNVSAPKRLPAAEISSSSSEEYSIQAAVYGNGVDAQKFNTDLSSKGYKTFIKESSFKSGKPKFIVYIGGLKDKSAALDVLKQLKAEEGIKGIITEKERI